MKKFLIYTTGLVLGASLMACDGYKEPNPPAQSNPQLFILHEDDIEVESTLTNSLYNLTELEETGSKIELAKINCLIPIFDYTFSGVAYISGDDFMSQYEVPVTSAKIEDQNVWELYISPANLSEVYHENISWSNDQASIKIRYNIVTLYTTSYGEQLAYVGGSDKFQGPYTMTILPLEADTHFYYLYTPGNTNGWNQEASQWLYSENENGPFSGYAILDNGGYKFTSAPNWDGVNYGLGDEPGILSTDSSAGNLMVDEYGLYWCEVNVVDLNYSTYYVETIGLIGSATPGGWDSSSALTSDDYLIWTGDVYLIPGEYKFRANDAWDVNLGGDPNSLTQGGDNIVFNGEEGTYTVTLDLKNIPYSCKVSTK